MLRTLLVEDDSDKKLRITRALAAVPGFNVEEVDAVGDAAAARRALAATHYGLLILDINIPERLDQDPDPQAGTRLLDDLLAKPGVFRVPPEIIGITQYEDVHRSALGRFSSRLLSLVRYDATSSEWELSLQSRVQIILDAAATSVDLRDYESQLGIVCALETPELMSVLRLPWGWEPFRPPGDHTVFHRGSYVSQGQPRTVHAAAAPRMGLPAAALLAAKLIDTFRPKFIGMVGITAGVRGRTHMGDVLVVDPCWDWGSGKWLLDADQEQQFQAAPYQYSLSPGLRENLREVGRDLDTLSRIKRGWQGESPPTELRMHIGPVASGASVLADSQSLAQILKQHRQLIGVEMEAYSIFAAADEARRPQPQPFVIKSVVDFADPDKDDRYRSYASYTSAEVLRVFAERYL